MRYTSILFDLDGTLLDTLADLTAAMNRTLTRHGLPERTRQQMRTALGNGARRLMELSVPAGTDSALFETLLAEYNADYAAHCRIETAPYPGVAALLQARCKKLTDIPEKVDFFDALPDYDVEFFTNKKSKTNAEVSKAMLEAAIPALEAISDWTVDAIHDTLIDLAAKLEVKNSIILWPLRVAVSGKASTPGGATELCALLGKEESIARVKTGIELLQK